MTIETLRAGVVRAARRRSMRCPGSRDQPLPRTWSPGARGMAVPASVAGPRGVLLDADDGELVAIARERRGDRWQPRVVLRSVPA